MTDSILNLKPSPVVDLLPGQKQFIDERGVVWRTLPHRDFIRVSALGEVERLDKRCGGHTAPPGQRPGAWRRRENRIDPETGHVVCGKSGDSYSTNLVYRLVAQTFLGENAWCRRVVFVNGDKTDVRPSNLCIAAKPRDKDSLGVPFKRKPTTRGSGGKKKKRRKKSNVAQSLTPARFPDEDAQQAIWDWHAGMWATKEEACAALEVTSAQLDNLLSGVSRPHLERPERRRRFQPNNYNVHQLRDLIADWNSGKFKSKREAAEAYGIEKTYVVRLLNGDQLQSLYDVCGEVTRIQRNNYIGRKKLLVLTDKKAKDIRERWARGETILSIAEHYGITATHAAHVIDGKVWKNAGGPIRKPSQKIKQRPKGHLTAEEVEQMRILYWAKGMSQSQIAKKFDISAGYVSFIVNGVVWQKAGGPTSGEAL